MFELKTIVTQPIYLLNYIMPCLITAPTRSNFKETARQKKQKTKISKNKNFTAKIEYPNLKSPSNNVKMHSDKITTQIHFLLTIHQMKSFLNETT